MNGDIRPVSAAAGAPRFVPMAAPAPAPAPTADPARARDRVELAFPAGPPPDVLDEIAAAAARAHELAAANRELHFSKDDRSGRIVVEVRDLAGRVIRTIPPATALDVMSGSRGWE